MRVIYRISGKIHKSNEGKIKSQKRLISPQRVCYGTFCRPCTICRQRQIVPTLATHFIAPCTIWRLATKCAAVVHTVLGWQNVPCKSAYFVVPHWMDLNIHSDIYLLNMKQAIYYILRYVYITFITYLHLH